VASIFEKAILFQLDSLSSKCLANIRAEARQLK